MRILIAQTSFLGDVILSTPVIGALKAIYADSELWMLTTPAAKELVKRDPLLAGVITFDKRKAESGIAGLWRKARELRAHKFDVVYSLHRSQRTALLLLLSGIPKKIGFEKAKLSWIYSEKRERTASLHDVKRNLQIVGCDVAPDKEELRLLAPSDAEVSGPLSSLPGKGNWTCVVPGSVWATKRWHWEHYRTLVAELQQVGETVVLLGSAEEADLCGRVAGESTAINLAGKISLSEMLWVVKNAKQMVCNDSMALHVASAFKIPTVAIFCATSPSFGFGPWRNRAVVVEQSGLACKPCSRHGTKTCPVRTEACMRELLPSRVLSALDSSRAGSAT